MPGTAEWLKRRRLSRSAKRRRSSERRCRVEGRPTWANAGSDPRARAGARRWNAPRSSCERITLRGAAREPEASAVACTSLAIRRAKGKRPVRAQRARGSASRCRARTTKRCAEPVREGASPAERRREPLLESARSRRHASPEACTCVARQPESSPRGGGPRQMRGEVRLLPAQYEEAMQLVVGARASSYCRNRQDVLGLREARQRHP